MKINAAILGVLALISTNAVAGIEDFVAGGGGGTVNSNSAIVAGGAAKAGKPMHLKINVENANSVAVCFVADFMTGEVFDGFYSASGYQLSYYPWTPPYDMVFMLLCGQESGTSGASIAFGQYLQAKSKSEASEAGALGTPAGTAVPASLMDHLRRTQGQ